MSSVSPAKPFDFDFDRDGLLADYDKRISKKLGHRYLAGSHYYDLVDKESYARYSKNTVVRLKSGIAHQEVQKFLAAYDLSDYEYQCWYIGYGDDDYCEWHIDTRPEKYCKNASRVNIFLTGKSYTEFRSGKVEYEQAVVPVMHEEHRYDNRRKSKRVMLQLAIKGLSHDELCDIIFFTHYK